MLVSSEAITLGTIKYGDSSFITKVYSLESGLLSVIYNRSKNKKGNKFQIALRPFTLVNINIYLNKNKEIHRLKEISLYNDFRPQLNNVLVDAVSFFIAEFLSKVIKEAENNKALFSFLKEQTIEITSDHLNPNYIVLFLRNLMPFLGIMPNMDSKGSLFDLMHAEFHDNNIGAENSLNKEDSYAIFKLLNDNLNFTKLERRRLLNNLIKFYEIQQDQIITLKSKEVLEVIFD